MLWTTLRLNLAVSGAKILVGTLTRSLSMVADGYHSLMDGSNNVIGLVVTDVRLRAARPGAPLRPPQVRDRGHPRHRHGPPQRGLQRREQAPGRSEPEEPPAIGALNWAVMIATLVVNLFVASLRGPRRAAAWAAPTWWPTPPTRAPTSTSRWGSSPPSRGPGRHALGGRRRRPRHRRVHRLAGRAHPDRLVQRAHRPRRPPRGAGPAWSSGDPGGAVLPRDPDARGAGRRLRRPLVHVDGADEPARRPTTWPTASRRR